jgi:hypothetical protein
LRLLRFFAAKSLPFQLFAFGGSFPRLFFLPDKISILDLKTGMKPLMDTNRHLQRLQSNGQVFKWKATYKSRNIHPAEDGSASRIFFKIRVLSVPIRGPFSFLG